MRRWRSRGGGGWPTSSSRCASSSLNLLVLRSREDPAAAADSLRGLTGVTMSIPASDYIEFGIAYAMAAWNPPAAAVLAGQMAAADPAGTDDITLTPQAPPRCRGRRQGPRRAC